MKKTFNIYIGIIITSLVLSFFKNLSMLSFINTLFLISILPFTYGVFRRMYEIGMFKYLEYSVYVVSRFFSSFGFGQKNVYADEIERKNLSEAEKTKNSKKINNNDSKKTLESFMLKKIEKQEYTLPCILASILSFATSYLLIFIFENLL